MSAPDGAAAVGTLGDLVHEYETGIDQLYHDGALMEKDPEAWWSAKRALDRWLLDRLQFGYVAKTAKQLADTRTSVDGDRGHGLFGHSE